MPNYKIGTENDFKGKGEISIKGEIGIKVIIDGMRSLKSQGRIWCKTYAELEEVNEYFCGDRKEVGKIPAYRDVCRWQVGLPDKLQDAQLNVKFRSTTNNFYYKYFPNIAPPSFHKFLFPEYHTSPCLLHKFLLIHVGSSAIFPAKHNLTSLTLCSHSIADYILFIMIIIKVFLNIFL